MVESCHLFTNGVDVTNVLPLGLSVDVSNGECVLRGRSTTLTIRESISTNEREEVTISGGMTSTNTVEYVYTNLVPYSVPIVVTASNGYGSSQVPANITIAPRYVSGDMSHGIFHLDYEQGSAHNNSNFIYKADNIPFATGGTGAYNDPLLIYVAEGADNISFVLDFRDVTIPVSNFASLLDEQKNFHIRFLNINIENIDNIHSPPEEVVSPQLSPELISEEGMSEVFFWGIGTTRSIPISFLIGHVGRRNFRNIIPTTDPIDTLRILFFDTNFNISSNGGGILRISLFNLDTIPTGD